MTTNRTSMSFHHVGGDPQQFKEPAWTINIKGVAIQCKRHNVLAIAPI